MVPDIIIDENFSDDGFNLIEKLEKREFESKELTDLRFEAEEITRDNDINELIAFDKIKKNLEFHFDYQQLKRYNGLLIETAMCLLFIIKLYIVTDYFSKNLSVSTINAYTLSYNELAQ